MAGLEENNGDSCYQKAVDQKTTRRKNPALALTFVSLGLCESPQYQTDMISWEVVFDSLSSKRKDPVVARPDSQ